MSAILAGQHQLQQGLQNLIRAASPPQRKHALMQGGLVVERWAKKNIRQHHLIDTRNLTNSVTAEPEGTDVTIGPRNVVYAAIHEFGGTITAKKAQYLAIPVTGDAKAAGSPRSFPGTLHAQGFGGAVGTLVDEAGHVQYVLKKSVTLPAKPYLRPALVEHTDEINEAIAADLRRSMGIR